jgi:hypothetical protein
MDIDQKLKERLSADPDRKADVILCGRFDAAVIDRVGQAGVVIKDRSQADDGLLFARLDRRALLAVQDVEGVDSVSGDETQYAL